MKQNLRYGVIAIIAAVLTFASGCKKIRDYIAHNPPLEVNLCSLQKIKLNLSKEQQVLNVTYNAHHNPVSVLQSKPNVFSNYDQHFRYDEHNRLSDYLINYSGNTGVLIWHTYTYINAHTIIDTAYNYAGDINDEHAPYDAKDFRKWIYKTDDWGRITEETEIFTDPAIEPHTILYNYNSQGNLIIPATVYDNKINIYRTNRVWMFIAKNYSMNNALGDADFEIKIKDYNAAGLPVQYKALPAGENIGALMNLNYDELEVEYDCSFAHNY